MAYHTTRWNDPRRLQQVPRLLGLPLLPLRSVSSGSLAKTVVLADPSLAEDIIDEAIRCFRLNVQFRHFELRGEGDKVLVYLILWIQDCLATAVAAMNAFQQMGAAGPMFGGGSFIGLGGGCSFIGGGSFLGGGFVGGGGGGAGGSSSSNNKDNNSSNSSSSVVDKNGTNMLDAAEIEADRDNVGGTGIEDLVGGGGGACGPGAAPWDEPSMKDHLKRVLKQRASSKLPGPGTPDQADFLLAGIFNSTATAFSSGGPPAVSTDPNNNDTSNNSSTTAPAGTGGSAEHNNTNTPSSTSSSTSDHQAQVQILNAYLRQLREETVQRLMPLLFVSADERNKWWFQFARKKFCATSLFSPNANASLQK
ncbi:unnamed protein product [Amoebophrya sp. A25]|nr:unnamed protein product [Amoebophrya sp. A25]|eukprot:GSA25T00012481001.1